MVLAVRESRSVCQSCVCVCFSAQGHDAQSDAGEGRTPALPGRAVFKGHHASFTPCITLHISELGPENAICPPFLLKPPPAVEQQCEILWACGVVFRVGDGQDPRIPNFHPSVLKREEPRQGRPVPESQGELTAHQVQPRVSWPPPTLLSSVHLDRVRPFPLSAQGCNEITFFY